ncbi:MAG: RAD55 family ATPase [Candidatus Bathyarchaeia archaeon]
MVSTGVEDLDRILEGKGYPERSAILLISPPGAGKAPLAYLFLKSGFISSDAVMCITSKPVDDLLSDMGVFGVDKQSPARYIQCFADKSQYNMSNLTNLFIEIKRQVDALAVISKRIYIDIISPLFMLHSPKMVYMFMSSLLQYFKDHGATVVASLDEGVVALEAQRSMEMIFDGTIEIKLCEERFNIIPLMRVKKMLGIAPSFSYYRLGVSKGEVHFYDFNT